jgi:photosystem II stability/assembly factor-like uncharacterized protein
MSIAILLALAAIFTADSPAPLLAATASIENIRLSDPTGGFPYAEEPFVAVDSRGRVFVGWKELAGLTENGASGFASSSDGGRTWSRRHMERSSPGATQSDPWLTVDDLDRVYYSRLEGPQIVISRSDDAGDTWTPLVNAATGGPNVDKGSMKSDRDGAVYVAYSEAGRTLNDWKIRVTRSSDGGLTWSPAQALGTGLNLFAAVVAARPTGKVWGIWQAPGSAFSNIMCAASSNRGETWEAPVRVNPVFGTAASGLTLTPQRLAYPSADSDSRGRLFVAWSDVTRGEWDIVVSRSEDDGRTWSAPVRVDDSSSGDQWTAALAVDARDTLHAAWYDTRTGSVNLYYSSSTDGGATWSPNTKVTSQETPTATTTRLSEYIGLAADRNGTAYMAWTDWRDGGPAIYFASIPGCTAPAAPRASNNGPVGVGEALQLTASTIEGASYSWTGPNDFRSSLQNASIPNATTAASGTYSVTATVEGCTSAPATTSVTVLPGSCTPGPNTLCLNSSRFSVQVAWRVPSQGTSGAGAAVPLTSDTGYFWFFSANNVEVVIKVVDGRAFNRHHWAFYGALSDVEYTITMTDMTTGATKTYFNPPGRLASVADTAAF